MTRKKISVHFTHSFRRWLDNKRISWGEGSGLAEKSPLQCLYQNFGMMSGQKSLTVKYIVCCLALCSFLLGEIYVKKERPDFIRKHLPCKVAQLKQTALLGSDPKPAEVSDRLSVPCRDLAAVPSSVHTPTAGSLCLRVPAFTCSGAHLLQQG